MSSDSHVTPLGKKHFFLFVLYRLPNHFIDYPKFLYEEA